MGSRITPPWKQDKRNGKETWRAPQTILTIVSMLLGLGGLFYGTLQSERLAARSGDFDAPDIHVLLQSQDLALYDNLSLVWCGPRDSIGLCLPKLNLSVVNMGQLTLRNAFLVLSMPTVSNLVIPDTFLSLNIEGPILSDSLTRSVTSGPAFTHVTFALGQINPGQAINISEIVALSSTEHTVRLDTPRASIAVSYAFKMQIAFTADDFVSKSYDVDLAMLTEEKQYGLEMEFLSNHYSALQERRKSMSTMARWASFFWKEDEPAAIFVRPTWRKEDSVALYVPDEPWQITTTGFDRH